MTRVRLLRPVLCILTAMPLATSLHAQTARSSSGSANAQAMQQLQQLASERTQLQAEVAKLKGDLEAARKERDSLKASQENIARRTRGAEAELVRTQADKARFEGELAREKQRFEEVVARFRETTVTVREVETDRAAKTQQLTLREQELRTCVDHNRKLVALNDEVLDKLEDQGFWSALARREPFTQIKRTQLENLADGYRGVAEDHRLSDSAVNP
jgi:chromosome segregation ATPase